MAKIRNLQYDGVIVEQPIFEGVELTQWVHDGVVVWENGGGSDIKDMYVIYITKHTSGVTQILLYDKKKDKGYKYAKYNNIYGRLSPVQLYADIIADGALYIIPYTTDFKIYKMQSVGKDYDYLVDIEKVDVKATDGSTVPSRIDHIGKIKNGAFIISSSDVYLLSYDSKNEQFNYSKIFTFDSEWTVSVSNEDIIQEYFNDHIETFAYISRRTKTGESQQRLAMVDRSGNETTILQYNYDNGSGTGHQFTNLKYASRLVCGESLFFFYEVAWSYKDADDKKVTERHSKCLKLTGKRWTIIDRGLTYYGTDADLQNEKLTAGQPVKLFRWSGGLYLMRVIDPGSSRQRYIINEVDENLENIRVVELEKYVDVPITNKDATYTHARLVLDKRGYSATLPSGYVLINGTPSMHKAYTNTPLQGFDMGYNYLDKSGTLIEREDYISFTAMISATNTPQITIFFDNLRLEASEGNFAVQINLA